MIPALTAALEYAARGWRVIPLHHPVGDGCCSCGRVECDKPGKHPRIMAWPTNASTDPATIERWWSQWPQANVGIACGAESDLWVMDVDGELGMSELGRLLRTHEIELPTTPISLTGGGGRHYLFRHAPNLQNAVRFAPGLDLRTEGGLIVAPPSVHASGVLYQWEPYADPAEVPAADAPERLLVIARTGMARPTPEQPITEGAIPEGQRNATLWRVAGSMRHWGMTEKEIHTAISTANQDRCHPPLDGAVVLDIARRASRYEPAPPRVEVVVSKNGHSPDPFNDNEGLWEGPEFEAAEFPEPEWLAAGLIPKAMLSMIVADPKIGKSVLAHGLCVASATGGPWLGETVPRTRCLYINWEDPPGLTRDRARKQMEGEPLPRGYFIKEPPFGKSLEDLRPWLVKKIRELKIGLLVVDPLAIAARWRQENDPYETGVIMSGLQEIAVKCGCAVVVVHHSTKSGGEWGKEVRGSGGIFGAVMSLLSLKRRTDGIFDLDLINKLTGDARHSLRRNETNLSWEITERLDADGIPMSGVQINQEENVEKCFMAVLADPAIEISQITSSTGLSEATVRRCMKLLVQSKRVMEAPKMNQEGEGRRPRGYWAYPSKKGAS